MIGNVIVMSGGVQIPVRIANSGIEWAAKCIQESGEHAARRYVVIADEQVALLYGNALCKSLAGTGRYPLLLTFPPGEPNKNLATAARLIDQLVQQKLSRNDAIIGLGGGISTDIAGFVASVYLRGIQWFAVPTSLIGMVDAAIGGKTGVDHPLAKNAIGTFCQPAAVLAPLECLQTLPEREWTSGSAEIAKTALLSGGDLWELLRQNRVNLRKWSHDALNHAIRLSADFKAQIVSADERESGLRRLLNLGHTLGHAIETSTGYTHFRHGEAVFLGLRAAMRLSERSGALERAHFREIDQLLAEAPIPRAYLSSADLLEAVSRDKKAVSGIVHWILINRVGDAFVANNVPSALITETAEWICEVAAQGRSHPDDPRRMRVLVVNGPNLNLLGTREPDVYGKATYSHLVTEVERAASELGCEVMTRQSNHEGEIVDMVQQARHWADAIIINPGGYTHTSVAIRDAIAAIALPAVEVHLSDTDLREEFRRSSMIRDVCVHSIKGKGIAGYVEAITWLNDSKQLKQDKI